MGQNLTADTPPTQKSPDFPGGVPEPDSNWEPCMDAEHCDQEKKADEQDQDEANAPPSDSANNPAPPSGDFWEDIKNNPPQRPPGKIKIPGKK